VKLGATVLALALLGQPGLRADPMAGAALANPLEDAGSSARAVGMGGAFVAVASDSSAMFWNPGGLARLKDTQLAMHHNSWIAGTAQDILAAGFNGGGWGNFGLTASYLDFGSFAAYDATGTNTGTYNASRMGLGLGWGGTIAQGLGLGLALKGQSQSIAGESLTAFSSDLGLTWSQSPLLSLGLAYAGLGSGPQGSSLASSLRFGLSSSVDFSPQSALLLAVGGAWQPDGVNRLQVGLESKLFSQLFLRGGYQLNLPDARIDGLQGMTIGTGFQWAGYSLDYAWQPFGELGVSQRISLAYDFGGGANTVSAPAAQEKLGPKWRKEGQSLESAHKWTAAAKVYRQVVDEDAKNGEAWKALGRAYLRAGKKTYAAKCFKQAAKLGIDDKELKQLSKETKE
jgi:hypothetical protein